MARYFEFLSQFYGFHLTHPRITWTVNRLGITILAHDQVIISNSEDNLKRGLYALHKRKQKIVMKISLQKIRNHDLRGQRTNKKQN
jgi:hypothetical protein